MIASVFLILGAGFCLLASLGILRMPDFYCRLHAATKAGSFGVALSLIGLCIAIPTLRVFIQAFLIIAFFYLTAPIAAHALSKMALSKGFTMWTAQKKK